MSDARWLDVEDDLASAIKHFSRSIEIFERNGLSGEDLPAYMARMSLMQAMQSGYTSLETALERILEILGEEKPTGANYHADLLRRIRREIKVIDLLSFPGGLPMRWMRPGVSATLRAGGTTAFVSKEQLAQSGLPP